MRVEVWECGGRENRKGKEDEMEGSKESPTRALSALQPSIVLLRIRPSNVLIVFAPFLSAFRFCCLKFFCIILSPVSYNHISNIRTISGNLSTKLLLTPV